MIDEANIEGVRDSRLSGWRSVLNARLKRESDAATGLRSASRPRAVAATFVQSVSGAVPDLYQQSRDFAIFSISRQRGLDVTYQLGSLPGAESSLPEDTELFPDGSFTQLEIAQPLALDGARAASPRDIPRDRSNVIEQVIEVDALLEMIASPIWHDARVNNVDLADRPCVKSGFWEELLLEARHRRLARFRL